jgi:crotonobetainyl-CoA:carnitine CoA-transferase CaiB-like acyl-CoA transferase
MKATNKNHQLLSSIWGQFSTDKLPLEYLTLTGQDPVYPSSFAIGTAAQVTMASAALAAATVRKLRGQPMQGVSVDMLHAAIECATYYRINGKPVDPWEKLSGLYICNDSRWVRLHMNFAHHRDGILKMLDLPQNPAIAREEVQNALRNWGAFEVEDEAIRLGCVASAVRSFEEWDNIEQSKSVARMPLIEINRIGDAPPRLLPKLSATCLPLDGIRVLDLTRVLAGPVGARALAAYGADVLLINSPNLPNIPAISETSRGKLSAHVDLKTEPGRKSLRELVRTCNVFMQGYRPGALDALGFGPSDVAEMSPGSVYVTLSAYGSEGPWSSRRGFDSLVQSAMGFNIAEAVAADNPKPMSFPIQILDHATGLLMAFAAEMALIRQQNEGGTWHAKVSLAQTAHWLRGLSRVENGFITTAQNYEKYLERTDTAFGTLEAVRHAVQFSETPAKWRRLSAPPGTHEAKWPN